ncbi:N-terminal nucleophile aminohydrolase [Vararia minispora EC-137]|uniref:N-terminal nucleophile aminohydrolase n=1 Tax=Vararia minispora EC-137 TaxID=1314806 RepID=A0ACB8QIU4_9AGAM|nr:N-terminal nucleophile aminohydrolase [Vararia minispora EC-137]
MCRWFAYIGQQVHLCEWFAEVFDRLSLGLISQDPSAETDEEKEKEKDVRLRNIMYNTDGFGVAWYSTTRAEFDDDTFGPRPAMYKTIAPPKTDPTFLFLCANTASKCVLAHVRAASAPPIVPTNNHPFIFGRHSFMHNGGVAFFPEIRHALSQHKISPSILAQLQGNTDSEHLAAVYMTHLGDAQAAHSLEEMKAALLHTIRDMMEVQKAVLSPDQLTKAASSLNLCTTDGEQLVAIRYRNHSTQQPPSLYISTTAGIILNRKYPGSSFDPSELSLAADHPARKQHAKHVIVVSEPTTFDINEWRLMDKNELLTVGKDMTVTSEIVKLSF